MSERRPSERRPARLWPAWTVAALAGAVLTWIWLASGQIRQMQVIFSYATVLLSGLALVVWLLFFSRLRPALRLAPLGLVALLIAGFFAVAEIRGVTGDWYPVVEWRWSAAEDWEGETEATSVAPDETVDLSSPAAFPAFLGANGNSTVSGLQLARDWQAEPPRRLWQRPVGAGWSGFAVAGKVAYTMEQRGDDEAIVAYVLASGEELWSHRYAAYYSNPLAGPGPRATPAVSQDRVFAFGASGILTAVERRSGKALWTRDVVAEHRARIPEHGKTSSPLLVDDLVVVSAGGTGDNSLVAYDQASGELVWQGGSDPSGYGSPLLTELAGKRQILIFNRASVAGHDPDTGRVLWRHDWPPNWPNVAPPIVLGEDRVLFSTGYGIGSKLFRLHPEGDALRAEMLWESPRLKAKFTNLVTHRGFVYGLDDGVLVCLDPTTGERRWKRGRYGHGNVLLVGDVLLVQTERGEMVMVEASPERHHELGRFEALKGKAWNPFALVKPYLLVRNDKEAALWELPVAAPG